MRYCNNCKQFVEPRKKFGIIAFIVLLFCTCIGGIFYLIYYGFKSKKCPICNSTNWGVKPPEPQQQSPVIISQQIQPITEGFKFCAQCGEKIESTVQFCIFCGVKIDY